MIPARVTPACTKLFSAAAAEFRLVVACCQWPPSNDRTTQLNALIDSPVDWMRVERLATRHRVSGLVNAALKDRDDVPVASRDRLASLASQIARGNLATVPVIARVSGALQRANLPFLVLKGLPLGWLAYNDFGLRHSKDLDLLVAPAHVAAAERLLLELGFRRTGLAVGLTAEQSVLYRRFRQHFEFVQDRSGVHVELHWRPDANALLNEPSSAPPQWVDLGGGLRLPCLPPDELLLNLCIHGAGHVWFRLKWIADVAALLAQAPSETAGELLKFARERDLDRPVEQALLLCNGLFPGAHFGAVSQPSRAGRWLARLAAKALLEEDTEAPAPETDYVARGLKRSRFLLRRNWRYRLEEAQLRATSPIDWQTCALAPSLQFLYPLLRLPLWVRRRWFPQTHTRHSS